MASTSLNTQTLHDICASVDPSEQPDQLLLKINEADRANRYRLIFTERDWYRVGGVISSDGKRLADNLEDWIDDNFDDDIMDFVARFGDSGYRVTSLSGKTHYLAAGGGDGPLDFIQIEIEEIQEVVGHDLIDRDHIPDSMEAIIDPMEPRQLTPDSVSPARYVCKNVICFSDLAEDLISDFSGDPDFRRFLDEWERSSASDAVAFKDVWSVNVLPVLRDVGEHKHKVKLLSPYADQIHAYDMSGGDSAGHILSMIASVDRESGFPMAWYFLLVTKKFMSHGLASTILQELGWRNQDFISFADKDLEIFESWVKNPYWL